MMSKPYTNFERIVALDADLHLENLRDLLGQALTHRQQIVNLGGVSGCKISTRKRNRLFRWVIEMLDKFNHECINPNECSQRCNSRCPGSCASRCHDNCRKSRTISFKTRQLTFLIIDMFFWNATVKDSDLQLLSTGAFFLAAKLEESFMITVEDACYIGDDIYHPQELLAMEIVILKTLKWKLNYPTAGDIARKLLLALQFPKELDFEIFTKQVDDFVEFCLLEHEINNYGVISIALTSIAFTFEKSNLDILGSEYIYTACQYFGFDTNELLECYSLVKTKIVEYYLNSQDAPNTMASQVSVKETVNDENKAPDEQEARLTSASMEIENSQPQATASSSDVKGMQYNAANESVKDHCRQRMQEYPSNQNTCVLETSTTMELQPSNQNYFLICKESLY